jgi:hypothetical protein
VLVEHLDQWIDVVRRAIDVADELHGDQRRPPVLGDERWVV